mgnify:CR=1 FL=1
MVLKLEASMESCLSLKERLKAAEILINARLYEQAVLHINSVLLTAVIAIAEKEGLKDIPLSDVFKKLSSPEYPFNEPFRRILELSQREVLETRYLKEYLKQVKKVVKMIEGVTLGAFFKRIELKTPIKRPIVIYRTPLYAALILISLALDSLSIVFPWYSTLLFPGHILALHYMNSANQLLALLILFLPLISALLSLGGLATKSATLVLISSALLSSGVIYTLITQSLSNLQLGVIFAIISLAMKIASCLSFGREDLKVEIEFAKEEAELVYLELELLNPVDPSSKLHARCRVDLSQEYLVLPPSIAAALKLPLSKETEVKVRLLLTEKVVPAVISHKIKEPLVGKTLLRLLGVKYSLLSSGLEVASEQARC